jgi:y4mF family transcriptional regulator
MRGGAVAPRQIPRTGIFVFHGREEGETSPIGKFLAPRAAISHYFPEREYCMMTPVEIGQAVRRARKAQGLRQDELAAAAGVGVRFVVELERGKPTVRLDRLLLVLSAVGLDLRVGPRRVAFAVGEAVGRDD